MSRSSVTEMDMAVSLRSTMTRSKVPNHSRGRRAKDLEASPNHHCTRGSSKWGWVWKCLRDSLTTFWSSSSPTTISRFGYLSDSCRSMASPPPMKTMRLISLR